MELIWIWLDFLQYPKEQSLLTKWIAAVSFISALASSLALISGRIQVCCQELAPRLYVVIVSQGEKI